MTAGYGEEPADVISADDKPRSSMISENETSRGSQ
jgi:hypothetical protein